eukprot:20031_5
MRLEWPTTEGIISSPNSGSVSTTRMKAQLSFSNITVCHERETWVRDGQSKINEYDIVNKTNSFLSSRPALRDVILSKLKTVFIFKNYVYTSSSSKSNRRS